MTNRPADRAPTKGITGVLAVCVLSGLAYLAIGVGTGQTRFGLVGLFIMLGYGAVLLVGHRRVEALALLGGSISDERQHDITQRALAFTANVLVIAVLGGFLVTLAMESDLAEVFAGLAALGGAAFLGGIVWHSTRG